VSASTAVSSPTAPLGSKSNRPRSTWHPHSAPSGVCIAARTRPDPTLTFKDLPVSAQVALLLHLLH
jgi:hypothetical protein